MKTCQTNDHTGVSEVIKNPWPRLTTRTEIDSAYHRLLPFGWLAAPSLQDLVQPWKHEREGLAAARLG